MAENLELDEVAKELTTVKDFIVFAGTGVVDGTGVHISWDNLLDALGIESQVNVKELKDKGSDYPDIAQEIYNKLEAEGRSEKYNELLKTNLRPTILKYSNLAREIIKTTKWIVTTNFDCTTENAFTEMQLAPKVSTLPNFTYDGSYKEYKLDYLHGNTESGVTIFKRKDYDLYYPSISGVNGPRHLENYLEWLLDNHNIVFIGFSFKDSYLKGCFHKIKERILLGEDDLKRRKVGYKGNLHKWQHYVFLLKLRKQNYEKLEQFQADFKFYEDLKKELESIGIKIVWIDEPIEWINCFEQIRLMQPVKPVLGNNEGEST